MTGLGNVVWRKGKVMDLMVIIWDCLSFCFLITYYDLIFMVSSNHKSIISIIKHGGNERKKKFPNVLNLQNKYIYILYKIKIHLGAGRGVNKKFRAPNNCSHL